MPRASEPAIAAVGADALVEPWFSSLREQLGEIRIFDCHTHLGCADPDGSCFDVDELLGALEVVDGRAVVFPLAEPDSYRDANDRVLAAAEAADGRLVAFCRVDPGNGGLAEAGRAVSLGAAGIKLHPRAERFGLGDRTVRRILRLRMSAGCRSSCTPAGGSLRWAATRSISPVLTRASR